VEITEPTNPKYIGILKTKTSSSIWRDVKTYNCHAFIVSEAAGHGMQVFDLTQLLNVTASMPVQFVETAHYNKFGNSHNIAINEGTSFAYAVGTNTYSGGLHIINIQNPSNPVSAGGFASDGYTHDCQCVVYTGPDTRYTNKEICFNYNEDTLTIVDVSNKNSIIQIGRIGYQSAAYVHQGWLTDDGRHVIVDDELDETGNIKTRSHVFNIESLTAPRYVGYHSGLLPTRDHNLYVKGNLVFEAK
jgi:choice-of-anchor B domain-containing protein